MSNIPIQTNKRNTNCPIREKSGLSLATKSVLIITLSSILCSTVIAEEKNEYELSLDGSSLFESSSTSDSFSNIDSDILIDTTMPTYTDISLENDDTMADTSEIEILENQESRPLPEGYQYKMDLNLLTHNIFGKEDYCNERAIAFADHINNAVPLYDIVTLNEHLNNRNFLIDAIDWIVDLFGWNVVENNLGCQGSDFTDQLYSSNHYINSNEYGRFHYPIGDYTDWFDWAWLTPIIRPELDGGVGLFSRYPIVEFHEHEWDSNVHWENFRNHGFTFSRVQIDEDLWIDVYSVHFFSGGDGCNVACRRSELHQLRDKMTEYSRDSVMPIIVMGDFNIGGPPSFNGNPGYQDILDVLGTPRDLWMEANPNWDKDGFTYSCSNELSSDDCDSADKRIDYIMVMGDIPGVRSIPSWPSYKVDVVRESDVNVVKWETPFGNRPVSDHYGVEARIRILELTEQPCSEEASNLQAAQLELDSAIGLYDSLMVEYQEETNPEVRAWLRDELDRTEIDIQNAQDQVDLLQPIYAQCIQVATESTPDYYERPCADELEAVEAANETLKNTYQSVYQRIQQEDYFEDLILGELENISIAEQAQEASVAAHDHCIAKL